MKFKVGDRVKVKSWDDMAREFGVNTNNIILCEYRFVPYMRKYCGRIMTVTMELCGAYELNNLIWSFTDDMLLPAPKKRRAPKSCYDLILETANQLTR